MSPFAAVPLVLPGTMLFLALGIEMISMYPWARVIPPVGRRP